MALIDSNGFSGVSIDAIAKEAGVSRPVVYGSFDNLNELLLALLDRQEQRALAQLMGALPESITEGPPEELLAGTVRRLVAAVEEDPATWKPVLTAAESTPEELQRRIDSNRELIRKRFEMLLASWAAFAGGPSLDAELASHALMGMALYFGRMLIERPGELDADRLVALLESMIVTMTSDRG